VRSLETLLADKEKGPDDFFLRLRQTSPNTVQIRGSIFAVVSVADLARFIGGSCEIGGSFLGGARDRAVDRSPASALR
jgi:hypothetical protein